MAHKEQALVGLDLGNSKTCVMVCYPTDTGKLEVVGLGIAESKGWHKGLIVNLDAAVLSIKKAAEAAESASGVPVDLAYVGVGGSQKGLMLPPGLGFNAIGPKALVAHSAATLPRPMTSVVILTTW